MSEREVKARVKLLMVSMGMRPSGRTFAPIAEEVTAQTVKEMVRKNAYRRINSQLNHNNGCLDRSMRLSAAGLNVRTFTRKMMEFTGFRIVSENMKFGFLLSKGIKD